ncbi:MAG: GAF domain-containing protein [Deltaproteobacteria bacterium]|nr:GAF domain-containing protein [Deltaproteobacteria bacterium]
MIYKILSKVIEFTDSDIPLYQRLGKVARLIVGQLPVDACGIYLWEKNERRFNRVAAGGRRRKNCVESYGEEEGLAGRAKKTGRAVDCARKEAEKTRWGSIEDRGLKGFRSAYVYPLRDGDDWRGILYLKAEKNLKLSEENKKILHVISKQLASTVKNEQNYLRLKNAYKKLNDLQIRLMNAEKLMAIGELSAALAHEIRNPLVSIGGLASRLRKKLEPLSPHLHYLDHITNSVTRLERIINDILNYAGKREAKFNVGELNSLVNESLWLFEEACRSHKIKVVKNLSKAVIPVVVDPQQIKIAFDNLIANAIQSMEHGGRLTLTTAKRGGCGVVEITDTGGGIEPNIINEIFTPFFTTKKEGTGLGLTITHKIITRHKGLIEVKNDYGRGMTFAVKLPFADKHPERDGA